VTNSFGKKRRKGFKNGISVFSGFLIFCSALRVSQPCGQISRAGLFRLSVPGDITGSGIRVGVLVFTVFPSIDEFSMSFSFLLI